MHVLVIPSWYPDGADAQRGAFFRRQARLLADAGHAVGVLTVPPPRFLRDLPDAVRRRAVRNPVRCDHGDGLPTYRTARWLWLPGRLFGRGAIRRQQAQASDRLWRRYVSDHGLPDVIHAQGALLGGYLAVRHGRRHGVPVVLTEHSSAFLRGLIRPDERPVVAAALGGAAAVCAVGPALAEALRSFAPSVDVAVVPNPVDVAFFSPPAEPPATGPYRFVAVAHLRPVKGVDVVLRAFAAAFGPSAPEGGAIAEGGTGPSATLRIAGDGPERHRLVELAAALGIDDRVRFLGALTPAALRDLYRDSHALVSGSEIETFGLAVAEALACGLRVVATRSGGPDGLVEAAGGWLTPVGDAGAMAEAMVAATRAPLADPSWGRAAVVACCSPEAWVDRMTAIFTAVASPASPAAPAAPPKEPAR